MYEELKARMRAAIISPFDLNEVVDAIEQLERQLAERDAEIAKLIQAVADHVTVRSEQYAEIAKYRDAPVVAYIPEQTINWLRRANSESAYCRCDVAKSAITSDYVPLIVKPGEQ